MPKEIIAEIVFRLRENPARISKCLDLLTEEDIWSKPNEVSNSIGNLILHLNGNITQYIISSVGGMKDKRARDSEFDSFKSHAKNKLNELIQNTIEQACQVLLKATDSELKRNREVQGFNMSGYGCAIHACEHLSYHVGQIALLTKLLTNKDLGFYEGLDLNTKNQD